METGSKTVITVETVVNASIAKVWEYWNNTEHITQWCYASPEWHVPQAINNLIEGGKFSTTMAAKDGSMSFDFWGVYTKVIDQSLIEYTLGDDRKVSISFSTVGDQTVRIVEKFEAESQNSVEMQQGGWQAILNNFKKYTEA